ncbi:MAG: BamA/TamA family outer membrane protein, partial [Bacteroidales bacterium]|nr:BamA/TamA family outer membrane protein [Bacteroidales bacterium]
VRDSVYRNADKSLGIDLVINEGRKYYFRNINWVGNTIYNTEFLDAVLGIQKGDVYNQRVLDANLSYNPNGTDITSLYMDRGYLFFNVMPVEVFIENDSIDLEMRIYEGEQARINKVSISGNNRTNDHVVIRELRTRPGQLFSRDNLIRTQRELAQLGYFDAEKIVPTPIPNPADNTVDIEYKVEETSSDQIELSGGWGYGRLIGTLGLKFSNFSARNLFNKKAWRPVPTGDGQELSVRFQTYGQDFYNLSTTFTEPWLGGKKPNRLSVSYFFSKYSSYTTTETAQKPTLTINGITVSLGKRLTWPDDFFQLTQAVNLHRYSTKNYQGILPVKDDGNGSYNKLSYQLTLMRNSVSQPIYPRTGSSIMASMELSPPYSLFSNKDYSTLPDGEKFKWMEFHKWRFQTEYFKTITGDLVFMARSKYGFIGAYNNDIGVMPFDRFFVGGDGMAGYQNFDGREQIGFRGYTNNSLNALGANGQPQGAAIYNKNTLELRYPLSLNPSATIFVLGFAEAGNTWAGFREFGPFNLYRSAGVGVRIFLPIFGVLGLDWGYGFDEVPGMPSAGKSQFHFSINNSID